MTELEVTWPRVLQVWWAYFWRGLVYILLPSLFIGAMAGIFMAFNKIPIEAHTGKLQLVGAVIGFLGGIWITRAILGVTYSGFRIALVATPASEATAVTGTSAPPQ